MYVFVWDGSYFPVFSSSLDSFPNRHQVNRDGQAEERRTGRGRRPEPENKDEHLQPPTPPPPPAIKGLWRFDGVYFEPFGRFKRRMTDSHGPRLYFETFVKINREREITEANKKQTDGFPPRLWFLDGEKKRLDDERALNAGTVEVHSGISKDLLSASCSFSRV